MYCRMPINGTPPVSEGEGELVYWEGDKETILEPARELNFCSNRCAWQYRMSTHKQMGMTGKQAREHLIEFHGLTEPGKR